MSRYSLSTFFLVLPIGSELCPRAGILESRRNNQRPRQPVFPFCRGSTDLVLICGKSKAVLRGTSLDYGSWSKWAYYSLGSRSLCLGHSVLPLPCENRRLSMGFCRDIFFLPVRSYRRSIWVSVLASNLLVLLQVGMSGNLSLLLVQKAQHAAPPKRHFSCVAPYSRMCSSLSPSNAAALTRH